MNIRLLTFAFLFLFGRFALAFSAEMETGTYDQGDDSLPYSLYVPENVKSHPGLLVVLHGCTQTADQMATGTHFNDIADKSRNFIVLYPEQTYVKNPLKCWNWFDRENLERGDSGELSMIAGLTQKIAEDKGADKEKVALVGFSAGAAMASNLLACYSDIYMGGAVHSGLEYAAAQSQSEAQTVMRTGPKTDLERLAKRAVNCSPRRKNAILTVVIHGTTDNIVNIINGNRTAELFEDVNVLLSKKSGGQGDVARTTKDINGKRLKAVLTETTVDGEPVVKKIIVENMAHAYSGGDPTVPYMEPDGPDMSKYLAELFFKVRR